MNLTVLYVLDILAELLHLTFQLGLLTRQHILPLVVRLYVAAEFTSSWVIDSLTSQQLTLKVRNTPFTTGFCKGTRRLAIA